MWSHRPLLPVSALVTCACGRDSRAVSRKAWLPCFAPLCSPETLSTWGGSTAGGSLVVHLTLRLGNVRIPAASSGGREQRSPPRRSWSPLLILTPVILSVSQEAAAHLRDGSWARWSPTTLSVEEPPFSCPPSPGVGELGARRVSQTSAWTLRTGGAPACAREGGRTIGFHSV